MMIEITQYKNAKKINEDGDIDCEIKHPTHGWVPFTLNLKDKGSGLDLQKLHDKIIADKQCQEYQAPSDEQIVAQKSLEVRGQRDELLRNNVDPIVSNPLRWTDLSEKNKMNGKNIDKNFLIFPNNQNFPK